LVEGLLPPVVHGLRKRHPHPMIGKPARDDAIFIASSVPCLVMAAYLLRGCWSPWRCSEMRSRLRECARTVRAWTYSAVVDEVDRIVQEKMQRQKVSSFRFACQLASVFLFPFTVNNMLIIATGQERLHTLTQDIIQIFLQSVSVLLIVCPGIMSERNLDWFFVFFSLSYSLYAAPWACRAEYMIEALIIADFCAMTMTTVRRSLPPCAAMNVVVTASTCSLIWVRGEGHIMRPGVMMLLQALAMTMTTVCNQVLDRNMASMIRQGLEVQAAKEVFSAAKALLKSCCDIVVELDSEGTITSPAMDLGSFLLRGPKTSLQGTPLQDLMASEEDRLFFASKLREPWPSDASLAEVRHVRMKGGNSEVLSLELLWFQFRHLDQQLRYMVGLKEFSDSAFRQLAPPDAAHGGALPLPPLARAEEEDAGGSIPEGSSVISDSLGRPPVSVIVDCTQQDHSIIEVSAEFCKRIGRVAPGQSFTENLKGCRHFTAWLQVAIQMKTYEREDPPVIRVVFRMPQGEMAAVCKLGRLVVPGTNGEEVPDDVPDLKRISLDFSDIKRRCGSSAPPDRSYLKGTPLKRLGL